MSSRDRAIRRERRMLEYKDWCEVQIERERLTNVFNEISAFDDDEYLLDAFLHENNAYKSPTLLGTLQ